jgi:hypothetical protein
LHFNPDPWQAEVSHDLANNRLVSVRFGQGVLLTVSVKMAVSNEWN